MKTFRTPPRQTPRRPHSPRHRPSALSVGCVFGVALGCLLVVPVWASEPPPLQPLPSLELRTYAGTWYQVAWFPNRFQRQCVSDTTATYRLLDNGLVEVVNACRQADGKVDSVTGVARPNDAEITGTTLAPARLQVSFLPAWLRWIPAWGDYWVIQLADDGRYAVVSEDSRRYLWVLARSPVLPPADETAIRSRLLQQGFVLDAWQSHPHSAAAGEVQPPPRDPSPDRLD